jgi:hypothetical protein
MGSASAAILILYCAVPCTLRCPATRHMACGSVMGNWEATKAAMSPYHYGHPIARRSDRRCGGVGLRRTLPMPLAGCRRDKKPRRDATLPSTLDSGSDMVVLLCPVRSCYHRPLLARRLRERRPRTCIPRPSNSRRPPRMPMLMPMRPPVCQPLALPIRQRLQPPCR